MKALTWVHLSDIHFFNDKRPRFDQKTVVRALARDVCAVAAKIGSPDLIFVTGDIAFSADGKQEYPEARAWLDALLLELGLQTNRVLIVPGNHDVDRALAKGSLGRRMQRDQIRSRGGQMGLALDENLCDTEMRESLWAKFGSFVEFSKAYGGVQLSSDHPFSSWVGAPLSESIRVVGLNTALMSYDDEDRTYKLALGDRQIDAVHEVPETELLLVLMHHPTEELHDGDKLLRVLAGRPAILFSGHMHQLRAMQIEMLGTSGHLHFQAGAGYGEHVGEHRYSWGRLDSKGLAYFPRKIGRDSAGFISDTPPSEIKKPLSPTLGDYFQQPLRRLPTRLQAWIRSQSTSSTSGTETPTVTLNGRAQALEAHLFGDSVELVLQERLDHVTRLRQRKLFTDARRALEQLSTEVAGRLALASDDGQRRKFQQWNGRCQVTSAQIHLEEHQPELALEICRATYVDFDKNPECLRHRTRIGLANMLMALDQTDEALRVLPNDGELALWDEEGKKSAALIKQAVWIKQGRFPDEYTDDELRLVAANKLLESGDATRAVRLAREVVERTSESEATARENALQVLLVALQATIWEAGFLKHGLPLSDRRWILKTLGEHVEQLGTSLDYWERRLAIGYFRLTEQVSRGMALMADVKEGALPRLSSDLPAEGWSKEWAAIMSAAFESSRSLKVTPALTSALEQLAARYPGRIPIEFELAKCLLFFGRAEDALPHARAAFLALPGVGQRLQLAQCLLLMGRSQRALNLVSSLPETLAGVLQVRANAMASLPKQMAAAVPLLHRYLAQNHDDGGAWFGLAQAQARLGHPEEAAEAAWKARQTLAAENLSPEVLIECAQLQLGSQQNAQSRARIEEIASILSERFASDPNAARGRLLLLQHFGFPSDHRIDISSLVQIGAVWEVTNAQALAMFHDEAVRAQHLNNLYRTGFLSLEALCELTNTPAPRYLTHVLLSTGDRGGMLCPPITYELKLSLDRLRGAHLVCGTLEIVLLLHLGLIDRVRKALGTEGKIIIFEDVLQTIQNDGLRLLRETKPMLAASGVRTADSLLAIEQKRLAVELQRTLEEGQRTGFIEFVPRPDLLSALPSVKHRENEDLYEAWVRIPLAKTLAYHRVVSQSPQRLLLTADMLTADPFSPAVMIARAMNWETVEQLFQLRRQVVPERMLSLSTLVRTLSGQSYDAQEQLLALGFQDALDPRLLFHLSRKYRGLDQAVPKDFLEGIEWRAQQASHSGQAAAEAQLSFGYGAAIWTAFCAQSETPIMGPTESETFVSTLLQRCEMLDRRVGLSVLFGVLEHVASISIRILKPAVQVTEDELQISSDSPAGRMWRFLSLWAGPEGARRGALGMAITQAWLSLDRAHREPDAVQAFTLYMAVRSVQPTTHQLSTVAPEVEALSILSAHWEIKPLSDIRLEEAMQLAALDLAQYEKRPYEIPWDERSYHYSLPAEPSPLALPAEAVLLRASNEVIAWAAPVLAVRQGLHDARAYDLLMEIAADPTRIELRRKYARLAVGAPWRQLRYAPGSIGTWNILSVLLRFPRTLGDLRRMLAETILDEAEKSLLAIIAKRTSWRELPHGLYLIQLACEIPGTLSLISSQFRLDEQMFTHEVSLASKRLALPNDQTAGRLCSEIVFLFRAVKQQSSVDLAESSVNLREVLPRQLTEVLASVATPRNDGSSETTSLASAEASLLRLCARKISELAGPTDIPMREGLWLCYRLFQWLVLQLDRLQPGERARAFEALSSLAPRVENRSDLLHPLHFARDRIDQRLIAVLQGMFLGIRCVGDQSKPDAYLPLLLDLDVIPDSVPREPMTPDLENLLIGIASRELTEEERSMRTLGLSPSCLSWDGPGAAPDLALTVLLMLTHGRGWLRLSSKVRLAWIYQLAISPQDKTGVNSVLALAIIDAAGDLCRSLPTEERVALLSRLQAMQVSDEVLHWRLTFYSALFASGSQELGEEVASLLAHHLGHPAAPAFFGRYLAGLSAIQDAKQVEVKAQQIFGIAAPDQVGSLIWGVGYLVIHGAASVKAEAVALLKKLFGQQPWRDLRSTAQLSELMEPYMPVNEVVDPFAPS